MLTVITPAPDLTLLTVAELREATGVTGNDHDTVLVTLGRRVAASITDACRVAADGATPATLRQEIVSDTFRQSRFIENLILSRRPIVSIASVVENDVILDAADYLIQSRAGLIQRLCNDRVSCWPCGKIVVTYTAGWATVPETLKEAASRYIKSLWSINDRDPLLKREVIPGTGEFEYWVEPTKDAAVPADVMDMLEAGGFVNNSIG